MPSKKSKSSTKTKPKARRAGSKLSGGGPLPPYGVAIREAIARGNTREMRQVAASARKYLKNLQAAMDALEKSMKDLEG
jgi:hypothetical protein